MKPLITYLMKLCYKPIGLILVLLFLLLAISAISLWPAVKGETSASDVHPFGRKKSGKRTDEAGNETSAANEQADLQVKVDEKLNGPVVGQEVEKCKQTYEAGQSKGQGRSLSFGYWLIGKFSFWIFLLSIATIPLVFLAGNLGIMFGGRLAAFVGSLNSILDSFNAVIVGAASVFLIGVLTQKLIPYGQILAKVLDVAGDVVNWLRISPVRQNVTSKIYARYDGLLKHVSKQGYSKVIILAHSLGSLITVDLLRYWKFVQEKNSDSSNSSGNENSEKNSNSPEEKIAIEALRNKYKTPSIPPVLTGEPAIELVTFGCPLNQLLGLRFTTLYGWCRSEVENSDGSWVANSAVCDPKELLGIRRWTNLYSAGDYVGRHIWHDNLNELNQESKVWNPACDEIYKCKDPENSSVNEVDMRREFCVGPGAHINYGEYVPPAVNLFRSYVRSLLEKENT